MSRSPEPRPRPEHVIDALTTAHSPTDSPEAAQALPLIGLTGAPAAGKSTVAAFLRESGCAIVDVDGLGHRVLDEPAIQQQIVADLGPGVLRQDGSLDRSAIGSIVFRSPDALRRLEAAVHPRVRELTLEQVAAARASAPRAVVLDVALLFEGGLARLCDVTVAVHAPEQLRIERAAARGWDAAELARRQAQQFSPDEKRARADRVVINDTDLDQLRRRALAMLTDVAPVARTDAEHTGT